jgi:predicted ABC-type ATPase
MPSLIVVAGPNGSGKTTLTKWNRERFQSMGVLDPDAIVRSNTPASGAIGMSSIDAGRTALQMATEWMQKRQSFVVETTLSGNTYIRMMREAKTHGYEVELLFVGTSSVEINMRRIQARVTKGGHDIPIEDQLRRYPRSMRNLQVALNITDEAILYDNSTSEGFVLLASKDPNGVRLFEPLPNWAAFLRGL